jgi:long-chain acyl-CoA synthetase
MQFETLNQLLTKAAETYLKPDAILYKKDGAWQSLSSMDWLTRSRHLALGLAELGVRRSDRVALLSENRLEWFLCDSAMHILGAVNVPIYSTLPATQIAYIVNDSSSKVVIASNEDQLVKLAEVRGKLPAVEHVVSFEPGDAIESTSLAEVEKKGASKAKLEPDLAERLAKAVEPSDLASIVYTSGTTGEPKGVMLTHTNLVSNVKATMDVLPMTREDVALSALPYCHVFERMVAHYLYPANGVTIAIAESLDKVVDNLGEIRPTLMTMVPRFYEKIYAKIKASVDEGSPTKQKIFKWAIGIGGEHGAYRLKGEEAPFGLELKYKLATALVFKKLRQRLGGRLRFFVSGAAPLTKEIAQFFWAAGIPIVEGYGLTETSPVICVNRLDRLRFGTVGPPIPGVEVEIAEDGEILTKGENVMKGYYRKEAETQAVIDDRGYFHTGDVGELDSEGLLRITDRKKDIIVTAGGKNIAPQPIEGLLKTNAYISEIVVVGNKRRFVAALVVPDFEKLTVWCRKRSIPAESPEKIARNPRVVELILEQIESMSGDFASYERIKKVTILAREFSLEQGEVTPTMKVKRNVINSRYQHLIDEMYL